MGEKESRGMSEGGTMLLISEEVRVLEEVRCF